MHFQTMKLEKGMYQAGKKGFNSVLEELDPSVQYKGTKLENLDAFQRQLYRFGVKIGGKDSSRVDKFFENTETAVLFPEYVSRAVRAGMEENNQLAQIVASTTLIEGQDYRPITTDESAQDKKIAEGEEIPQTTIFSQKNLVKLNKRGRLLVTSYEAVRFQRLDLFAVTLKQIGASIARAQMEDAVNVLLNGDGNTNAAEVIPTMGSGLTYLDMVNFWGEFGEYDLNTMIASNGSIMDMVSLDEFKNPLTGLNFAGTGALTTPVGASLIKSKYVPYGKIIGMDRSCALEKISASGDGVLVDYDKLIDRQLERASIISTTGFAKIFPGAAKVLQIS